MKSILLLCGIICAVGPKEVWVIIISPDGEQVVRILPLLPFFLPVPTMHNQDCAADDLTAFGRSPMYTYNPVSAELQQSSSNMHKEHTEVYQSSSCASSCIMSCSRIQTGVSHTSLNTEISGYRLPAGIPRTVIYPSHLLPFSMGRKTTRTLEWVLPYASRLTR